MAKVDTGDFNLDIKYTFLNFAQRYFAQHPRYTWQEDVSKTKILIVDKYAIKLKVLEKARSIVLSRGAYGWEYTSIGQLMDTSFIEENREQYSDLLRGSITFNCLAQNGIVAETIAHILFTALTGFKSQFRANGIHKILNVTLGEETILKSDSSSELSAIPINVQFSTQKHIRSGFDYYTFYLVDVYNKRYYQGVDYRLTNNNTVEFFKAPLEGTVYTAFYTNAITLESTQETLIGEVDGVNTTFSVSSGVYGEYPIWSGLELTTSGAAWAGI